MECVVLMVGQEHPVPAERKGLWMQCVDMGSSPADH